MEIKYTSISIRKRLLALCILVTFFLFALLSRLLYLQIISAKNLASRAYQQWYRDLPLTANRGSIFDRNGALIASSYTTYDIYVRPADILDCAVVSSVISAATGNDYNSIFEKVSKKGISEVLVCRAQEKSIIEKIIGEYQSGIFFTENTSREYAYGDLLTQVLGFVSSDGNGQGGLESQFNKYLKGIGGVSLVESDIKGTTLDSSLSYFIPSIDGLNLGLTIDVRLQIEVEKILEKALAETGAKSASAIIMDPQTGEILSLSTKPSYDLNNIPRDDIETLLKLSRATAITDAYEPGSTFKVLTTAIALSEGLTSLNDYFYCPGYRMVDGVKINCHRRSGHGSQSLAQGLSNSCNCVFMELIDRIGLERFYKYLDLFGISSGYNLDFPGEGKGILMPSSSVKQGDLLRMGFGQSVALTPLALLTSICAAINGGRLMQPHFVTQISTNYNTIVYSKQQTAIRQVLVSDKISCLNQMLRNVVANGGGKNAAIAGYDIGGKTGTAQKYENGAIADGKYVASFMGFYPTDVPKYAVLVVIDEPQGAYYGGVVAAPVAKSIFEAIFDVLETPKNANAEEEAKRLEANIDLPSFVGLTTTEAIKRLTAMGFQYLTMGDGIYVKDQIPAPNSKVCFGDIVLLMF